MIAAFRHECVYGEACHSGHHFDCRLEFLQRNDIKHQYVGDAYFPKVNGIYPRFVPYLRRRRLFIWSDSTWELQSLQNRRNSAGSFFFYWLLWGRRESSALVDWAIIG